jgi:protein-tyrosine phosphatase
MYKILFVCHGNICRSPMAEFVMKDIVSKAGKSDEFYIASCATSTEEIGNPVHHGTRRKLAEVGISCDGKRAVQLTKSDYDRYDYIIAMDEMNIRNIMRIIKSDPEGKVSLLLSHAGMSGSIADPWYTGNFDDTYRDVLLGCKGLFREITSE